MARLPDGQHGGIPGSLPLSFFQKRLDIHGNRHVRRSMQRNVINSMTPEGMPRDFAAARNVAIRDPGAQISFDTIPLGVSADRTGSGHVIKP